MTTYLHCVFLPVFAFGLLLLLMMSLFLQLVSRSRVFICLPHTICCKLFCFNYYTFQLFHTRTRQLTAVRFFFALCLGVTHTKRIEIRCGLQKLVGLLWFFFSRSPTNSSSTSKTRCDTVHSNVNNLQPAQLFNAST